MLVRFLCFVAVGLSIVKITFDGSLNGGARIGIQGISAVFEKLP